MITLHQVAEKETKITQLYLYGYIYDYLGLKGKLLLNQVIYWELRM